MKKKQVIWLSVLIVVCAVGVGAYMWFDRFVGNNVEIESVMAPANEAGKTEEAGATASAAGAAVSSDKLNGMWHIADGSKVYWSVTTSKSEVNFVDEAVTGSWSVNLDDAAAMVGEGAVDLNALDSGNSTRDQHVKERDDFLDVAKHPQATFKAKSFSAVPKEWNEGTSVPLTMTGTLNIRGIDKEVTFDSNAMYKDGQLLLSGKTQVTFADFGMTNPHTVVMATENEFAVQVELVMNKM
ncbi:YceI family protein [Paenibacillus kobensis]|uniref:YceI family protein n=1 Tax=Paenibacillus kobensis TaxID=59841 RepID=UPI000FDB5139|nr:YceI family protein [Paenibacillus kobensis]